MWYKYVCAGKCSAVGQCDLVCKQGLWTEQNGHLCTHKTKQTKKIKWSQNKMEYAAEHIFYFYFIELSLLSADRTSGW